MKISKTQIDEILKTLPIGYYCGRKINVSLNDEIPTSCYSPTTDEILISSQIIQKEMSKITPTPDFTEETAIRSMLYHEVSHAILTPSDWDCRDYENVFEDERIETLLKGYYLDTNFKKQLQNITGDQKVDFNDPKQAFFSTVRFRTGKKEFVDRVEQIINKYDQVHSGSNYWEYDSYRHAIRDLYEDICRDIRQHPMSQQDQDKLNGNLEEKLQEMADEEDQMMKDNQEKRASKKPNKKPDQNQLDQQDGEGEGQSEGNSEGKDGDNPKEAAGSGEENGESQNGDKEVLGKAAGLNLIKNALEENAKTYRDTELAQQLEIIFDNFNKKNSGGNSTVAYSGRLNPRNFLRDDYKYFDKKVSINGNNKYGTCHLNLFIDDSGSFSCNKDRVNTLIAELIRVESRNKNFTFDLIRCGNGMTETDGRNRYIRANDGTHLEFKETRKIFRKHQKKNTLVYNIVLYDGECDAYGRDEMGYRHPFKYFDTKNTTMILECSNKRNVEVSDMHSATIVYEDNNYCDQLTKHVIKALNMAFR